MADDKFFEIMQQYEPEEEILTNTAKKEDIERVKFLVFKKKGRHNMKFNIVRKIASEIRGDVSLNDRVVLNNMKRISITSRNLDYGINVDDVFWVSSAIIRREQVRESKDEEIIAEIVATMLLESTPATSSSILDEYYGLKAKSKRASELEERIRICSSETVRRNFVKVFDEIKNLLNVAGKTFNALISKDRTFDKVPRYYQIVFLAFYKLLLSK